MVYKKTWKYILFKENNRAQVSARIINMNPIYTLLTRILLKYCFPQPEHCIDVGFIGEPQRLQNLLIITLVLSVPSSVCEFGRALELLREA